MPIAPRKRDIRVDVEGTEVLMYGVDGFEGHHGGTCRAIRRRVVE